MKFIKLTAPHGNTAIYVNTSDISVFGQFSLDDPTTFIALKNGHTTTVQETVDAVAALLDQALVTV